MIDDINRSNSDTLPQEYNEAVYTSKTDMFYLAELFNRMLELVPIDYNDFSHQDILEKMMRKNPEERYDSFEEIKNVIGKHDFANMNITDDDKEIYLKFANALKESIASFTNKRVFNHDVNMFISKLQDALEVNLFESYIQDNSDVIGRLLLEVIHTV